MWLPQEEYTGLVRRVSEVEASNQRLNQYFDMLLRHLRLRVWTDPGIGPRTILITEEDYQNRVKATAQVLSGLGSLDVLQQAFADASCSGLNPQSVKG